MAEKSEEQKRLEAIEAELMDESVQRFDDFIEVIFLIATSTRRTKAQKLKAIAEQRDKLMRWNSNFIKRNIPSLYRDMAKEAAEEVGEKLERLSSAQLEEVDAISSEMQVKMDGIASKYASSAETITIKRERERIREEKLGYEDGAQKQVTSSKSKIYRRDVELKNSEGKIISTEFLLKLAVGDLVWATISAAKASTWIKSGYFFAIHESVIDDRTTVLCRSLDGRPRDMRKDPPPPLHKGCRSRWRVIVDKGYILK